MTTPTRVTKEAILAKIAAVDYVVMPDGRTTICQLTMQNGFTVRGESSCVSVENFNKELGEKYAYEKAFDAAWAVEGYLLAELRHREARGDENRHREEQEKARHEVLLELMEMLMVSDTDALLRRARTLSSMVPTGSFGWAIGQLKMGRRVAREGWNGKGLHLIMFDTGCCNGVKNVFILYPDERVYPWHNSPTDMLADDWVLVE